MKVNNLINSVRAGDVQRWHVNPNDVIPQNVAQHSWNVAQLLMRIFQNVPRDVIIEALQHDCGEVSTGDVPYWVKADKKVREQFEDMEFQTRLNLCMTPRVLSDEWVSILKQIDKLDAVLHLWRSYLAGSRTALNNLSFKIRNKQFDKWFIHPHITVYTDELAELVTAEMDKHVGS